jgi:hypothetical protein
MQPRFQWRRILCRAPCGQSRNFQLGRKCNRATQAAAPQKNRVTDAFQMKVDVMYNNKSVVLANYFISVAASIVAWRLQCVVTVDRWIPLGSVDSVTVFEPPPVQCEFGCPLKPIGMLVFEAQPRTRDGILGCALPRSATAGLNHVRITCESP